MVNPGTYAAVSAACAVGVIYHAFSTRRQFYLVMIYLSHSKISLLCILNMGFVLMCGMWQLVNIVFLGALRETEVERLNEQVWREIMDILFAMTVFRDEFNLYFLFLTTVLLFIKAHHWLAQKRVEYIETTPSVPALSHVRLCTFMALLLTLDSLFFHRSLSHLLKSREASVFLFFAFEYVILVSTTIGTFIKYALHVGDTYMEGRFSSKAVCLFYLELVQDLLHLFLYLLFFLVIFMHYGLPLHLVRELYETFRNFKNRIAGYLRYRRLTYNMNERFAEASAEDLHRDATCIVCREDMVEAKSLPCGHLFHIHCLRQWLQRQNTCPTCRAPVLGPEDEPPVDQLEDELSEDDVQAEEGEVDFPPENIGDNGDGDSYGGPADENATNWQEIQAAATTAAANYSSSFVLPVLSHGCAVWYPALLPFHPHVNSLGRVDMDIRNEGAGQHDDLASNLRSEMYAPAVMVVAQRHYDVVQRWIWKHTIVQTAELLMQLRQNATEVRSLPQGSTSASPRFCDHNSLFASLVDEREEGSQDQSQRNAAGSNVQNDARLTYLRGVTEILRKHLQQSLEFERQISAMTVEQPLSVSEDTGGGAVNRGLVHLLQESDEDGEDCEGRSHVSAVGPTDGPDGQNGSLSIISSNTLYNSSFPSSSTSPTVRAETSYSCSEIHHGGDH